MLQLEARAKVNLWLKVVGRRSGDGYHLIDSLVAFADLADVIEVETSDRLSLRLGGPFVGPLDDGSENLVLKAARLLADILRRGLTPRSYFLPIPLLAPPQSATSMTSEE